MGRALYREYRPKSLDGVVGQKHITDTLQNAVKKGAISHAYLFTGPRGVGKTSIARILAHQINDLDYDESQTHLDIIEIDAASNRRIDEIRDLRDKVHIAPSSAKYKVYIIDEVHMLTREAFNALLKTLEEPPEHAVFILATTEAHKVPETIISRTQRYTFKPIAEDQAVEHLRTIAKSEGLNIDTEALQLLADHGRGSFRDSISMLDQIAGFGHKTITAETVADLLGIPPKKLLEAVLDAVNQNDSVGLFDAMQRLREHGANAAVTAQQLIHALRAAVMEGSAGQEKYVQLMKELLPLTGVHSGFEAIEIALLDAIDFDDESAVKSAPKAVEVPQKVVEKVAEPTKPAPKPVKEVPTSEEPDEPPAKENLEPPKTVASEQDSDAWQNVLNGLKGNHNTLYGLLRMAEASFADDTLTLVFQFDFHKKQLNTPKHLEILHKTVTDTTGKKHTVDVLVSKDAKPKKKSPAVDSDNTLSSVSNIFGGAELLD